MKLLGLIYVTMNVALAAFDDSWKKGARFDELVSQKLDDSGRVTLTSKVAQSFFVSDQEQFLISPSFLLAQKEGGNVEVFFRNASQWQESGQDWLISLHPVLIESSEMSIGGNSAAFD